VKKEKTVSFSSRGGRGALRLTLTPRLADHLDPLLTPPPLHIPHLSRAAVSAPPWSSPPCSRSSPSAPSRR
jgi:hypothetical protein